MEEQLVLWLMGVAFLGVVGRAVYDTYTMVLRWRNRRRERANWKKNQDRLRSLPESLKEGSELTTDNPDKYPWLFGVYADNGSKKSMVGSGFLIRGFAVTATHVVVEIPSDKLYIRMYDGVFIPAPSWHEFYADASCMMAPPGYRSGNVRPLNGSSLARFFRLTSRRTPVLG